MAELLVRTVDNVSASPGKNKSLYKNGQVVVVMPDGHTWGTHELKSEWRARYGNVSGWRRGSMVVKIPGAPVEDFLYLLEPKLVVGGMEPIMEGRRKKGINMDAAWLRLSAQQRAQINTDGWISVDTALVNDVLKDF